MNTPRQKPLRRFGRLPDRIRRVPDGSYTMGLWDQKFTLAIGEVVTFYPVLEHGMSELMAVLIGGHDPPVQEIFYSIVNQQARIKVMRSLLENSQINKDRDASFDLLIDDFSGIGKSRSDYAHGVWWTHSTGRVFLAIPDPENYSFHNKREVILQEIEGVIARMNDLAKRLRRVSIQRYEAMATAAASRDMPLPPSGEKN